MSKSNADFIFEKQIIVMIAKRKSTDLEILREKV